MFFGSDGALYLARASRAGEEPQSFARLDPGSDEPPALLHLAGARGKHCRVYSHWAEEAAVDRGEPELANFAFLSPGGIVVREGLALEAFEYP